MTRKKKTNEVITSEGDAARIEELKELRELLSREEFNRVVTDGGGPPRGTTLGCLGDDLYAALNRAIAGL